MTQYIYDIKYGHYRPLNEDGTINTSEQNNDDAKQDTQNQDTQKQDTQNQENMQNNVQNLETEDVLKVRQEKENKLKESDNKILQKNNNIIQLKQQLNDALNGKQPTSDLQKKLLQAEKELSDAKFEKAKIEHDMDIKILQVQLTLVESLIIDSMPTRYQGLNEEQLSQCKIYLNSLIENDPIHIINEMSDFKKIMGNANMLYGKDQKGYFAICIDQYDINKLMKVMTKAGYLQESVEACCFSQIYL